MDDKLIKALKVIRDECRKYNVFDCNTECPLYDYDNKGCRVVDGVDYPRDWYLKE